MEIKTNKEVLMISNVSLNIKKFIEDGSAKVHMLDENKNKIMDIVWDDSTVSNKRYYVVNESKQYIQFLLKEIVQDYEEVFFLTEGEESLRFLVKNIEDGSESAIEMLGRGQKNNAVRLSKKEEEFGIDLDFRRIDVKASEGEFEKGEVSEDERKNAPFISMDLKDVEEKIIYEDVPLVAHYSDAAGTEAATLKNRLEELLKEIKQEETSVDEKKKESILAQFVDIENGIYENLYRLRNGKIKRIRENV